MKKNCYAAALAAMLATFACNKNVPMQEPAPADAPALVTVSVSSPATRVTVEDTAEEAKVSTLDVFIFRGDVLDAHERGTGTSLTVQATQGERTIFAVVNAEETLTSIASLNALKAKVSKLLSNSPEQFVMTGSKTQTLGATASVNLDVARLAARFKIDKFTNRLTSSTLASSFSITRIFLTTEFEGGRHARRVGMIDTLDQGGSLIGDQE